MKNKFSRSKLLTVKKQNRKLIGYARASEFEVKYLNEQIESLRDAGCNFIFSEIVNFGQSDKPELTKAFATLSKGDHLVLTQLDRAFQSKSECIKTINKLLNGGIYLRTLSGFLHTHFSPEILKTVFSVLSELDKLEQDNLSAKREAMINKKRDLGKSLGGRPKISGVKESLVIRLRNEGCSYRSIRSQTGIALSTIRRIIKDLDAA